MQVFVGSKSDAHKLVKRNSAKHVLSILDPGDKLFLTPRLHACNRLHLAFDDVLDPKDPFAPTLDHVQRLLDWAKNIPDDDTVVVHCFAGISRSTAAAIAILAQLTRDVDAAVAQIAAVRPRLCPNPVISKYADDILGFGGELHDACEKVANFRLLTILATKQD